MVWYMLNIAVGFAQLVAALGLGTNTQPVTTGGLVVELHPANLFSENCLTQLVAWLIWPVAAAAVVASLVLSAAETKPTRMTNVLRTPVTAASAEVGRVTRIDATSSA